MPGCKLISLFLTALSVVSVTTVAGPRMPDLHVESLASQQLSIPEDLPELSCVLVVGFSKASARVTRAWSQSLEKALPVDAAAVYSVSVLGDVPRLMRGLAVRGIRSGVPDVLHPRFLVATEKAQVWRELAGYSEPDAAYVLLFNADRELVWRTREAVSEAAIQALVEQL